MFDVLFAWSYGGHGQVTVAAVAAAVAGFNALGKTALMAKLVALAKKNPQRTAVLDGLLAGLPFEVQMQDVHPGNAPWFGLGEAVDKQGQVRHFMRSTLAVSSSQAYTQSVDWIKTHLTHAWENWHDSVTREYHVWELLSSDTQSWTDGFKELAAALHTAEDSFAQGHVIRDPGSTNRIREVLYWSDENKAGNPATGRLPHEDYDDPGKSVNAPFLAAAKVAAGELILCVLSNLDGDRDGFTSELDQRIKIRFNYAPGGEGDFPAAGGATRTG